MRLGVNVPNFGPGAGPEVLRRWAQTVEGLHQLSGQRLVLGVGVGWARQEFAALDVPFERRGRLTDSLLEAVHAAWADTDDYGPGRIPLWIGGNGEAGLCRTVSYGDAWHPLRLSLVELRAGLDRLRAIATGRDLPAFAPRIRLRLLPSPVDAVDRPAGVGTLDQVLADLAELRALGADTVVFDPFDSDPEDRRRPETYWRDLATVMEAL